MLMLFYYVFRLGHNKNAKSASIVFFEMIFKKKQQQQLNCIVNY